MRVFLLHIRIHPAESKVAAVELGTAFLEGGRQCQQTCAQLISLLLDRAGLDWPEAVDEVEALYKGERAPELRRRLALALFTWAEAEQLAALDLDLELMRR